MGKDKALKHPQQAKMDKYAVSTKKPVALEADTASNSDPDKLSEILAAIQASRLALEGQIGGVQTEVLLIRQDLRNVVDRVTDAEGRLSEMEDTIKELKSTVQKLSTTTGTLEFRAEDAENRARRNNLRFVGIQEGIEGPNPETFLEEWLRSWMPAEVLSTCFVVERAHRTPGRKPPVGAPPPGP